MNQRQQHRKLNNGEKSSLTPQRIEALESLGFRWFLGKGVRGKDRDVLSRTCSSTPSIDSNDENVTKINGFKRKLLEEKDTIDVSNIFALTDDLVCDVLSFLPSLNCILSFCLTSKRASRLLATYQMEQLCQRLYIAKFGMEGINLNHSSISPFFWRNVWHNIYCLSRGLKNQAILDEILVEGQNYCETKRKKIGILSQDQEEEAIFYDNPSSALSNTGENCLGYYGMLKFNVRVNAIMRIHEQEMLAVWGDFDGVRIIDGYSFSEANHGNSNHFQSIADRGFGQILTAIAAPVTAPEHPCLYLGCDSGAVLSVTARFCPNTMSLKFDITSATFSHTNKVTSLTWLSTPGTHMYNTGMHLISGGCDGKVHLYLESSSYDGRVDLNKRVLCCSETIPILSLASCNSQSRFGILPILITGDGDGNIKLWKKNFLSLTDQNMPMFVPLQSRPSQDICRITNVKVVGNKLVVSGDTSGSVRVWNILNEDNGHSPKLEMLFKIPAAHGGAVELIEVVGDVLLTAGGNDGCIRGWNLNRGDLIGSVSCHDGVWQQQRYNSSKSLLKSSVVALFFTGFKSLVSLCRDGSIKPWGYGDISGKNLDSLMRQVSWDLTDSEIEGGVVPAAAVLANLAGKSTSSLLVPHSNPSVNVYGIETLKDIMMCVGNNQPTEGEKRLKDCMRLSIIKAAYEHASNPEWSQFPETSFIGADGRVYKYVKYAFASFSGMRPCTKCQMTNNGVSKSIIVFSRNISYCVIKHFCSNLAVTGIQLSFAVKAR